MFRLQEYSAAKERRVADRWLFFRPECKHFFASLLLRRRGAISFSRLLWEEKKILEHLLEKQTEVIPHKGFAIYVTENIMLLTWCLSEEMKVINI